MSSRIKRKSKVVRTDCKEIYRFKNGVAKVPGVRFQGRDMLITLKEFEELREAH